MAASRQAQDARTTGGIRPGHVLLVSCYELGHQPLAVAWAAGFLERAGHRVRVMDLAVEEFDAARAAGASLIAVSVPMHTALRIGVSWAGRLRAAAPGAHVCFWGLYATLNADYLLGGIADSVVSGEAEPVLLQLAEALASGRSPEIVTDLGLPGRPAAARLCRTPFAAPSRRQLPGPDRYARLEVDGATRTAGAVEASRGCLHHCRHCPIPAVYGGRFFVVPRDTVLGDVAELVRQGVSHVTFADPDFFNGPGHSLAIVRRMHELHPDLTFDITTKVEHIVKHRRHFPELAACGCLFVVSAVESLSPVVLTHLDKGHTAQQVFEALGVLGQVGIAMRPTLVAFTPWTTIDDYLEVLDWIEAEELIEHLDPVQFSIRLLVPPGSLLAGAGPMAAYLGAVDAGNFVHPWAHPDPRMDRLHETVSAIVARGAREEEPARGTFARIRTAAHAAAGRAIPVAPTRQLPARLEAPPPRLTEPWFC